VKASLIESFGEFDSPIGDIIWILIDSKFYIFLFPFLFDRIAVIYIPFFKVLNFKWEALKYEIKIECNSEVKGIWIDLNEWIVTESLR